MSGASIRIDSNEPQIAASLTRIGEIAGDIRPVLADIGAAMVTSTQMRFERKVGPDGMPWRPLSRRTARARIRAGKDPANILRLTNRLYQTLTYRVDGGVQAVGSAAWGTNVRYGVIHQFGGVITMPERSQMIYQAYHPASDTFDPKFRPKRASNFARDVKVKAHTITIPARPYLGIDDGDRQVMTEIVETHLQAAIAARAGQP